MRVTKKGIHGCIYLKRKRISIMNLSLNQRKPMLKLALILTLFFCLSCTSRTDISISPVTGTEKINGLRFYEPTPYLLIGEKPFVVNGVEKTSFGPNGSRELTMERVLATTQLVASIIYLPNLSKPYVLQGGDQSKIKLKDGWCFDGFGPNKTSSNTKGEDQLLELVTGMDIKPGMYQFIKDPAGNITNIRSVVIEN